MDDLSDPSAVAVFNHLNSSLVLSREISAKNIFPAFDPLVSSSNNVNPEFIGQWHYNAILETKYILQKYKEIEDIMLILGFDELDDQSKTIVKKALQLQKFFSQNFYMTEHFTLKSSVFVNLGDTIGSVEKILKGEFLDLNPEKFSYIGSVDHIKI